jgi:hypothetical protein
MMFAVAFGIWIKCKDGELDSERSVELPFTFPMSLQSGSLIVLAQRRSVSVWEIFQNVRFRAASYIS